MQISQGKIFEKPTGGTYIGTVIDLVDMPAARDPRTGQPALVIVAGVAVPAKDKVRIQWVLAYENNAPYLDKEGAPMTITGFYNAVIAPKSKLSKALVGILGGQVPVIQATEQLEQLVLGRSNRLMITQEPDQRNPNELFSNIVGILPLNPGQNPLPSPAGFVRAKFRTQQTAGPQGKPVATYATREAAVASNVQPPVNNVSLARPVQTVPGPEAF